MSIANHFRVFLTMSLFLLASSSVVHAQYSGGTGTVDDPYRIATAADLIALGETPDDYDKHFILTADIDLDPNLPGHRVFDKAVIAPTTVEHPKPGFVAFRVAPFTGAFDGRGHQISRLTIRGEVDAGLFGYLAGEAEVRNVRMVDVNITGSAFTVGGLVGQNCGTVSRCYSTGSISGNSDVGGLVGGNYGTVTDCNSTGAVTGKDIVGGLVGRNWGTMADCRGMGAVTGADFTIGGLVGLNGGPFSYGSVTGCYSTGPVKSSGEWVGGLVGDNWGSIAMSYSQGPVNARNDVGGFVGRNIGSIMDSYSSGSVSGDRGVGGLVGGNEGGIATSYSSGAVDGTGDVGGLLGRNGENGRTTASFWDIETSGWANSAGGTGKTTAEMQTAKTFLNAGWDFIDEAANGTEDIWWILEGQDYPRLWWELDEESAFPDFVATEGSPEGVAVDKAGNVYVSVAAASCQVWRFSPAGEKSVLADLGQPGSGVVGLALDAEGSVYVCRALTGSGVYRIAPDGRNIRLSGTEHIVYPNSLAFDSQETLYITETVSGDIAGGSFGPGGIWRLQEGEVAELWLRHELLTGLAPTLAPYPTGANGIGFHDGNVYVANTDRSYIVHIPVQPDGSAGQPEIWKMVEDVPESSLYSSTVFPLMLDGLALDAEGNVYIAVPSRNAIVRINAQDRSQETVAVWPEVPLDAPASLAFAAGKGEDETLFVTNLGICAALIPDQPWPGPGLVKTNIHRPKGAN